MEEEQSGKFCVAGTRLFKEQAYKDILILHVFLTYWSEDFVANSLLVSFPICGPTLFSPQSWLPERILSKHPVTICISETMFQKAQVVQVTIKKK